MSSAKPWPKRIGVEFHERSQNEQPLVHTRMRDGQPRLVYHLVPEGQQVDIDDAGTPALRPDAPHLLLDLEAGVEEFTSIQEDTHLDDGVQVVVLLRTSDRRCLVDARRTQHRQPVSQEFHGRRQIPESVTHVGPEAQVGLHDTSASTLTSSTPSISAARGL